MNLSHIEEIRRPLKYDTPGYLWNRTLRFWLAYAAV